MKAIFGLDVPNELLAAEYEIGASIKYLSEKYGRAEHIVYKNLKLCGCMMRARGIPTTCINIPDEDIKHFYGDGDSLRKIGMLCGCSTVTIRKRLKKLGCVIRSPGTEECRRMQSAIKQGISYDEWEGFANNSPYCPKFDNACRESNREKYGNRCFLCGKMKDENGYNLSVHHVNMNKNQGCDGHAWKLVPLCGSCHATAHSNAWKSRIEYLLRHAW